jgi:hypothetical protein
MIHQIPKPFLALFFVLATVSRAQSADQAAPKPLSAPATGFVTVDGHTSNLIRVDPQVNWGQYRAYRLLAAVYEPDGSRRELSPRDAIKVTAAVDRSLQKTFKASGGDNGALLEVRPIVMAVKRTNTLLNVLGFAAIQAPVSFGAATVRYELFDRGTGRQIGVISCRRAARPWNVYPWNVFQNFEALGQSSVILASDSRRLRKDIDRLGKLQMSPRPAPLAGTE